MSKHIVVVLGLAGTVLCVSASTAQQSEGDALTYYQRHVRNVLGNFANHVRPTLSRHDRDIIDRVDVLVPAENGFVAQATQQRVVISAGVAWILEVLASATIAEFDFGQKGCEEEYYNYMARATVENTNRIAAGLLPMPALAPDLLGSQRGGACAGFSRSQIQRDAGDSFAKMVEASIALLYLHEMAHHVLGHTKNPPPSLDYSRANEARADAWAIATAFKANYNLLATRPLLLFMAAIGGTSLEAERKSTHPLGIRRVHSMMLQAREVLVQQGEDEVVRSMDEDLNLIGSLVPSDGKSQLKLR